MAHDRQKIFKQAKEAIEKNNLFFIEDIVAWLPITKKTLYEWWPADSDECNTLKELLEQNKIKTKSAIRAKLYKSPKAAELLALYKLICTEDERRALSMTHVEANVKNICTPILPIDLTIKNKDDETN